MQSSELISFTFDSCSVIFVLLLVAALENGFTYCLYSYDVNFMLSVFSSIDADPKGRSL